MLHYQKHNRTRKSRNFGQNFGTRNIDLPPMLSLATWDPSKDVLVFCAGITKLSYRMYFAVLANSGFATAMFLCYCPMYYLQG
jgi:hypothetical protein